MGPPKIGPMMFDLDIETLKLGRGGTIAKDADFDLDPGLRIESDNPGCDRIGESRAAVAEAGAGNCTAGGLDRLSLCQEFGEGGIEPGKRGSGQSQRKRGSVDLRRFSRRSGRAWGLRGHTRRCEKGTQGDERRQEAAAKTEGAQPGSSAQSIEHYLRLSCSARSQGCEHRWVTFPQAVRECHLTCACKAAPS